MTKQKTKFNRRRALDCKLIRPSKTHKGYYKYDVTIGEKDGTQHKEPAYGKDMQDALSRLINQERTVKVEKKINIAWVVVVWFAVMGWPAAFATTYNSPIFILFSFAVVIVLTTLAGVWYRYLNKG
jgi:hypothetical protein